MLKKILFFSFFLTALHAEPLVLMESKKGKLIFKDGSIYRLSKESSARFSNDWIGSTFDVVRIPKDQRKRSIDTSIKNSTASFFATCIAQKAQWRQINVMKRSLQNKKEKSSSNSRLMIVNQTSRMLKMSDGSVFEAQTVLPHRKIEGEEVSIEKVEFYQLKLRPGEKILLKQIRSKNQ